MAGKTTVQCLLQAQKRELPHVPRVLDLVLENYGSWVKLSLVLLLRWFGFVFVCLDDSRFLNLLNLSDLESGNAIRRNQ